MVGLYSSTQSKLAVIGGILTIAIADAFFRNPCYGFILEDAKRVEPRECKGMLNFFEVDL